MVAACIQLTSLYLPWTPDWLLYDRLPGWFQAAGLIPVAALLAALALAPHGWVAQFGMAQLGGLSWEKVPWAPAGRAGAGALNK